jgi:N-acetylneuraminate lyase
MSKKRFTGINAALYTAYRDDGGVNYDETARLAGWLIEKGISGLYLCGTTGDGLLLSMEERRGVVKAVAGAVGGKVPLMVHVGTLATRDAIELARHAAQCDGVSAISSLGPVYYPLPWPDQIQHLSTIAGATDLPFYPYLFSDAVQGQGVSSVLASFAEIPHMAGIKAFVQDLSVHQRILTDGPDDWELLHGHDQSLAQALAIPGVDGAIGSMYNVVPEIAVAIYQAAHAGDHGRAAELHRTFVHYWNPACTLGSPLTIGRYWLTRRGFVMGEPRPPKRFPSADLLRSMKAGLTKSGFDIMQGGM